MVVEQVVDIKTGEKPAVNERIGDKRIGNK
jgi:hypothetical protein